MRSVLDEKGERSCRITLCGARTALPKLYVVHTICMTPAIAGGWPARPMPIGLAYFEYQIYVADRRRDRDCFSRKPEGAEIVIGGGGAKREAASRETQFADCQWRCPETNAPRNNGSKDWTVHCSRIRSQFFYFQDVVQIRYSKGPPPDGPKSGHVLGGRC